jgi:hypothetical protein
MTRERRLREYEDLLAGSDFVVHEVVSLPSGFSILDGRIRAAARPRECCGTDHAVAPSSASSAATAEAPAPTSQLSGAFGR